MWAKPAVPWQKQASRIPVFSGGRSAARQASATPARSRPPATTPRAARRGGAALPGPQPYREGGGRVGRHRVCQKPAHRILEERTRGPRCESGATEAAEKGDGPCRAVGETEVCPPCGVLLPGVRVQNSGGGRPPVDATLIALGVFPQAFDDPAEA